MCTADRKITVTVPTDDQNALGCVGEMFLKMAKGVCLADEPFRAQVSEPQAGLPLPAGIPADPDAARVDPGAAFAANQEPVSPFPAMGSASPADLTPVVPGGTVETAPVIPPAAAALAPSVPLDKSGLPWDQRINTGNKAQTAKGIWKRAPGLTDEFYQETLEQLKRTMAGAAPAAPAPGEVVTTAAPAMPMTTHPPVPPAAVVPAAPVAEDVPTTFPLLLAAISKRTGVNPPKITSDEIAMVCAMKGIESLAMLNNRPELIPAVYEELAKIWNTRG